MPIFGLFCTIIIVISATSFAVPHAGIPNSYHGLYHHSSGEDNLDVRISADAFGLEEMLASETRSTDDGVLITTRDIGRNCSQCRIISRRHQNVLEMRETSCMETDTQLNCSSGDFPFSAPSLLINVRARPNRAHCPPGLTQWHTSRALNYDEYYNGEYVRGCGLEESSSQLNGCESVVEGPESSRRSFHFAVHLRKCPQSDLTFRSVLQYHFNCLGSWTAHGLTYYITKASYYEQWEHGVMETGEGHRCLVSSPDGTLLGEGFDQSCKGLGGPLTTDNARRIIRLEENMLRRIPRQSVPKWLPAGVWKKGEDMEVIVKRDVDTRSVNVTLTHPPSHRINETLHLLNVLMTSSKSKSMQGQMLLRRNCIPLFHCVDFKILKDGSTLEVTLHEATSDYGSACIVNEDNAVFSEVLELQRTVKAGQLVTTEMPETAQEIVKDTLDDDAFLMSKERQIVGHIQVLRRDVLERLEREHRLYETKINGIVEDMIQDIAHFVDQQN